MSKRKDRARAAAGQRFQNGQPTVAKMATCVAPDCGASFVLQNDKPPLCPKHLDYLKFLVWALPRIRIEKQEEPGGIVLPGNPEFLNSRYLRG